MPNGSYRDPYAPLIEMPDGALYAVGRFVTARNAQAYGAELAATGVGRLVGVTQQVTSDGFRVRHAATAEARADWPRAGRRR